MNLIMSAVLALVVTCLGLVAFAWRSHLRANIIAKQYQQLDTQVKTCLKQIEGLMKSQDSVQQHINEVQSGTLGMGSTLKNLVGQLAQTEQRQAALEAAEPDSKMYQQAARLAQQGATVDNIMSDCGLPRGEAELLVSIHQK